MVLQRFLKYINFLIGAVVIAALVAVYWYAWRPLPQTSGTLEALVTQPASIVRDALGGSGRQERDAEAMPLEGWWQSQLTPEA